MTDLNSVLTDGERRCLDALLSRMFPDTDGRGDAVAIGAGDYIAAALAGAYSSHVAEYRALLVALDAAAGGAFVGLDANGQDAIVARFEAGSLAGLKSPPERSTFDLVWRHLREGLFGDPAHGGNRDMAGWRLVGFPGAQYGYAAEEQTFGRKVEREPAPLADVPHGARLLGLPKIAGLKAAAREPDVLIVGAGAVGAFLAHQFSRAGLDVLILEAGPPRTGRERAMDELLATAFRNEGGAAKFNAEVPTWRLNEHEPARRASMSQGLETALGGNSIAWGAVAMRFYEDDFRIRSSTIERYGEAAIPQTSTMADWPMSYAELAPFYDLAEEMLGVSGTACNVDGVRGAVGNTFEAPRSRGYDMPALRTSGLGARFADAARSLGYHPFNLPAAITTRPHKGRHACTYCSFCSRFGCHVDAKASIQNTVLQEIAASGRVRIEMGARVLSVETDDSGRAVGVRYRAADGETRFQGAGTTVVATYAFENSRLLLLSRDRRHTRGLGNETGQVGKHYITRQQGPVYALFDGQPVNRFIGPTAQAMAVADLSADFMDHTGLDFIRGSRIAAFNQYLPIEASGVLPPDVPRWGAVWRDFFVNAYNSTSMLFLDAEVLSYDHNYLDLDPHVTDDLGRPVTRITFDLGENEKKLIPFMQGKAEEIARAMGATRTWRRQLQPGPISTHDVGGTRMGHDPATSVVDGFGRVHDTPGLVVLGGSNFVSLPAVNPALSILALALRAGAAIVAGKSAREAA